MIVIVFSIKFLQFTHGNVIKQSHKDGTAHDIEPCLGRISIVTQLIVCRTGKRKSITHVVINTSSFTIDKLKIEHGSRMTSIDKAKTAVVPSQATCDSIVNHVVSPKTSVNNNELILAIQFLGIDTCNCVSTVTGNGKQ